MKQSKKSQKKEGKKTYKSPTLLVYGALQDLTKGGSTNAAEGSGAPDTNKRS